MRTMNPTKPTMSGGACLKTKPTENEAEVPAPEQHEPMGVHAPQWCATCSEPIQKMEQWVPWPCPSVQLAEAKARIAQLEAALRAARPFIATRFVFANAAMNAGWVSRRKKQRAVVEQIDRALAGGTDAQGDSHA